jgi:type I restriction enzyme S subunit
MLSGFNSPTITQEQFISTPIPLPPLSEQNQIVEFLSSFEDENINLDRCFFNQHIENKIKQLHESQLIGSALQTELKTQATLLTQLRQAYLQEAVMGQLTAQTTDDAHALLADIKAQKAQLIKEGKLRKEKPLPPIKPEEIPFEIPENWVWCRLGEVIILGSGQDLQPHEYSDIDNEGLPYITGASNLEDEKVIINRWTKTPKSIASRGDLLLTCKGSGVGKMAWLDEEKVHIARQIMSIRSSFVDTRYIKFILQLNAVKYRANAKSLIPGIDRNTVLLTLISLPPLSEQQAIVAKVAGLLEKVSALEAENKAQQAELERLMSAVLQESFSTTVSQTVQEV